MVATKQVLGQLASVGESAVGKLAHSSTTHRMLEGALVLKERVERLVTGFESLEQRLAAVEQRLDALEKPKRTTTRKPAASKTAAKPSASSTKSSAASAKKS